MRRLSCALGAMMATQVEAVLEKLGSVGERMRKRCKVDGGGE